MYPFVAVAPVNAGGRPPGRSAMPLRQPSDEKLGFEAAVAALGEYQDSHDAEFGIFIVFFCSCLQTWVSSYLSI